jgi:octaprenyl-diphosphate synthase
MDESTGNVYSDVFLTKLNTYRVTVDKAISRELHQYKDSPLFMPFTHALKRGKRLRPIILLLAFESAGGQGRDPLPAAVAIELMHMQSLIHDDIIDGDLLRRGSKSFHAAYDHELALLGTDFVFSVILNIVAQYEDHRVAQALALAASLMCEGELDEIMVREQKRPESEAEYLNIISKKTASLYEAAATLGAVIAGAREDEIKALSDYGRLFGMAFQIWDDLADQMQDTEADTASFLGTDGEREKRAQEISARYIREAEQGIQKLKSSDAKSLLFTLTNFIGTHSVKMI